MEGRGGQNPPPRSASDFGAPAELGAFFHGENLGLNIAVDLGLVLELAALGSDFALDVAVNFHVAGGDIAFDLGVFADGDLALLGVDLALDLSIDDHVVREADRADDFDAGGENVGRICHNVWSEAEPGADGKWKEVQNFADFRAAPPKIFSLEM